ncbi:hypothetical protein COLO4_14670 [Corchorus olitorius]|uniref:Uncharacterized protein n=1 Tax=Corchorus olitorius TaxID=93759 RepID=A0A1R3JRJ4_9ROSI|nr:hypothetical protein COLO4_14670 [Corchorus olitorius]
MGVSSSSKVLSIKADARRIAELWLIINSRNGSLALFTLQTLWRSRRRRTFSNPASIAEQDMNPSAMMHVGGCRLIPSVSWLRETNNL